MAGAPPPEYAATSSILRGSAVSESAVAFASIAANEKNARDRTRTPELNRELHGKSQSGQLRNPDQAQVVGAMAIQAWYRAARARAVAVGDRLPETVDASGLVRALPRAPPPLLPSRAPPPRLASLPIPTLGAAAPQKHDRCSRVVRSNRSADRRRSPRCGSCGSR